MGALTLPCSSVIDVLNNQSAVLQQWFASETQRIDGFIVRKCEAWLEPVEFAKGDGDKEFDNAQFHLMICSKRDIWRIPFDLVFYREPCVQEDGSNAGPGLQFNVLDENGERVLVDYFPASPFQPDRPISAEQFCRYWFAKLLKSHHVNRIFAYKEYEAEVE